MENLHERGYRERQRKMERIRTVTGVVFAALVGAFLTWGVGRIDSANQALYEEQVKAQGEVEGQGTGGAVMGTDTLTDTVWVGVKRATLESGDVVLRIGVVGE